MIKLFFIFRTAIVRVALIVIIAALVFLFPTLLSHLIIYLIAGYFVLNAIILLFLSIVDRRNGGGECR